MKKKLLIITALFSYVLFGFKFEPKTNYGYFYLKTKTNKEKQEKVSGSIEGKDVHTLKFGVHLHPDSYKDLDLVKIIISRGENGEQGIYSMTGDQLRNYNGKSDEHEGYYDLYPRVIDFEKNSSDGTGSFYHPIYKVTFNANYFVSRKGIDYSTRNEVDEYDLCGHVVGYKIIKYDQQLINGKLESIPVYGDPIYLVPVQKIKVKTSADVEPMPKSNSVRDVNELDGIASKFNNASNKAKGGSSTDEKEETTKSSDYDADKKAICDCFSESFEGKTKRWKCFLEQKNKSLKYKGDERKQFISETNDCADKEE